MRYENLLFKGGPFDGEHHLVDCEAEEWVLEKPIEPDVLDLPKVAVAKDFQSERHVYFRNCNTMYHQSLIHKKEN